MVASPKPSGQIGGDLLVASGAGRACQQGGCWLMAAQYCFLVRPATIDGATVCTSFWRNSARRAAASRAEAIAILAPVLGKGGVVQIALVDQARDGGGNHRRHTLCRADSVRSPRLAGLTRR